MRAAVTTDDGAFEVATVDDPRPRDGELLLRVSACGLCGSDLKARPAMPAKAIMGHESAARSSKWVPAPRGGPRACRRRCCRWRRAGPVGPAAPETSCTARRPYFSVSAGVRAASPSSPWCRRPRRSCFPSPSIRSTPRSSSRLRGGSPHHRCRGNPRRGMPCWWSERARLGSPAPPGHASAGPGGSPWWIPTRARRAGAGSFGATDTLSSAAEAEPGGYDVAIECVGKPGLLDACIAAARPKGRIVVAGVCTEQDPFWSIAALMKELTIHFVVYYTPDEFRTVIEAFGAGAIEPGRLVGRTFALERARRSLRPAGRGFDPRQDPHRSELAVRELLSVRPLPGGRGTRYVLSAPRLRRHRDKPAVFSAFKNHRHVLAGSWPKLTA